MLDILIKQNIVWLAWLLLYVLILKYNTAYLGRRIYLYTSLLVGLLFPLFTIPFLNKVGSVGNITILNLNTNNPNPLYNPTENIVGTTIDWWSYILLIIYGLGFVNFSIKTIREAILIWREQKREPQNDSNIIYTNRFQTPFSFFGKIYIPINHSYSADEISMIIQHEQAHNAKKHYVDLLILQIIQIFFWFHPIIWIYKHLFRVLHENEADAIASKDKEYEYAQLLLKATAPSSQPIISHTFFHLPIKNRITMLTKKSNNNKWKLIISIPLIGMSILAMKPISDGILNNMDKSSGVTKNATTTIEWVEVKRYDTIEVYNGETNKMEIAIMENSILNDAKTLNKQPVDAMTSAENDYLRNILGEKITNNLKAELKTITQIMLTNVIIDKNGMIQYYDISFNNIPNADKPSISEMEKIVAAKQMIGEKIEKNQKVKMLDDDKGKIIFYLSYSNIILR